MSPASFNLDILRNRLAQEKGPFFWRSLDELADTAEFKELLHREFPAHASEWSDAFSRRKFLKLMGASLALAGLAGCTRQPEEKIVPYVKQPESLIPGKPRFYATTVTRNGFGVGLIAESHEGRPTKLEGNIAHAASLGSTTPFDQAEILNLYHPDRARYITNGGEVSNWSHFISALHAHQSAGLGPLHILTETTTSPTLVAQLQSLMSQQADAHWHSFEPILSLATSPNFSTAFTSPLSVRYRFDQAKTIVSLDFDFLSDPAAGLAYARQLSQHRRSRPDSLDLNRLYVAEATMSLTGATADHRLPLRPDEIETLADALEALLNDNRTASRISKPADKWLPCVVDDLRAHPGESVIVSGPHQTAAVHAIVHRLNEKLGNLGRTVFYSEPIVSGPRNGFASLRELTDELNAGSVRTLVILGGNPAFTAPTDIDFRAAVRKASLAIHLSLFRNETSALCHWHVPEAHFLEGWSDARAFDGTASIIQPLIEPLYGGKTSHEVVSILVGEAGLSSYDVVRRYWRDHGNWSDFETTWRKSLHDGLIAGTAATGKKPSLAASVSPRPVALSSNALQIQFQPDPTVGDGRYAHNPWLQELPKPFTHLTWENAALISPSTAAALSLAHGDRAELTVDGKTLEAPLWILPGQADQVVTVHLGYGSSASEYGYNPYVLVTSKNPWFREGLKIKKIRGDHRFATTQRHHNVEGRSLLRVVERNSTEPVSEDAPTEDETLYHPEEFKSNGYAWGMVIDLTACIGCNSCVAACQAENNIPTVGRDQVIAGREMHWIRVDTYYSGNLGNPRVDPQPVTCMHCENAPCELVCPVAATLHDSEGLNLQVYNRCIGTRYCSNNCPYKVRRFNFFQYVDTKSETLKLSRNPDVTVRMRGVMEKCTYCVQRINSTRYKAELENRPIRDGEIVTACQAACPTEAIIFGDTHDPSSRVSRAKSNSLNYGMLAELNTRPRTTYLSKRRNLNPDLTTEQTTEKHA